MHREELFSEDGYYLSCIGKNGLNVQLQWILKANYENHSIYMKQIKLLSTKGCAGLWGGKVDIHYPESWKRCSAS